MVSSHTMTLIPLQRSVTVFAVACAMLGSASLAQGADLAQWIAGEGVINQAQAQGGSGIADGVVVHNSGASPSRVELLAGGRGVLTLSPGADIVLHELSDQGLPELEIDLTSGKVQVNVQNKGRYADVRVVSGNLNVRVTGTLFVVEHMAHDTAYLALIHGAVMAYTKAMSKATDTWLKVVSHQGIGLGDDGLLPVEPLYNRPQVTTASNEVATIRSQATTASANARLSSWHHDDATAMIISSAIHGGSPGVAGAIVAQDPAAAADAFVSLNTSSSADAKALVTLVAQKDIALTARLLTNIAIADPASASAALVAAVAVDSSHAALLAGATIKGDPAHGADYAVAAAAAAPAQSAAIITIAVQVDPTQANEIREDVGMLGGPDKPAPTGRLATTSPSAKPGSPGGNPSDFHLPGSGGDDSAPALTTGTGNGTGSGSDSPDSQGGPALLNIDTTLGLGGSSESSGGLAPYGGAQSTGGGASASFISPQTISISPEN
jgi:hypothetical protein